MWQTLNIKIKNVYSEEAQYVTNIKNITSV
jgi:hypothetical protein